MNMHPHPMLQSTDRKLAATARAFVVYDRATGEILHIHHSLDFGTGVPARETPEERARRLAGRRAGPDAEIMEVDPAEVRHREPMRVDVGSRKVVRL
jgi:hypothetical protein